MIIKEVKKLREKVTENWSFDKPPRDSKEFGRELIDAMWSNSGVGISANQLGYKYRVFASSLDMVSRYKTAFLSFPKNSFDN